MMAASAFYDKTNIVLRNEDNFMRRYLLALKSYNLNNVYVGSYVPPLPRLFYDFCDELGIFVYKEWNAAHYVYPRNTRTGTDGEAGEMEVWLYDTYNHPSIVMYSLGGELFESQKPSFVKSYNDILNPLYDLIKTIDRQDRPVCQSSGRYTWELRKAKTDVCDLHAYAGGLAGSWTDESNYIRKVNGGIRALYGADVKPVISFELSGGRHSPAWEDLNRAKEVLLADPPDRDGFVTLVQQGGLTGHTGARHKSGLYGLRRYADDQIRAKEEDKRMDTYNQIYISKGSFEEIRRCGDLIQGFGPGQDPYDVVDVLVDGELVPVEKDRGYSGGRTVRPLNDKVFVTTEAYPTYRRCYSPRFICLDVFDKNVFAGRAFTATVNAINDIDAESSPWRVRAVIRDPEGIRIGDMTADVGRVQGFKRKRCTLSWPIPGASGTGFYRIELFLYDGDALINDNYYSFFVLNAGDLDETISAGGKQVALYDTSEGRETGRILSDHAIPHTEIEDFEGLSRLQVLIIGARSCDRKVADAGQAIREWVSRGGRLLQYEQAVPGAIPYMPGLSLVKRYGHILSEVIYLSHPIFNGLTYENWDRWNGDIPGVTSGNHGGIFASVISPLNASVLASGCMGVPRGGNDAIRMVVSEVKVGRGTVLLSQAEAVRRYQKDSVATKYLQNTLEYILSDKHYGAEIGGLKIGAVNPDMCGYVDLKTCADVLPETDTQLSSLKGGMSDFGGIRFVVAKSLRPEAAIMKSGERKELLLAGKVTLIYPEAETRFMAGQFDQGGLSLNRAYELYLLHTAAGTRETQKIATYKIHYKDGTAVDLEVKPGVNIGTIETNKDFEQANYVGNGLYLTKWINPHPEKELMKIGIEAGDEGRYLLLGITGRLIREKLHD